MNSSSDAAESIVRMSLQGIEVAAKLTGSGAKNVGALVYTILKDNKQTKGKTTLTNMLKSGKPSKVFSVKQDELKKFVEEAKRYGVLYCVLFDKKHKSPDGIVDIMVREEDASKINRIVERFKLSTTDKAEVESIIGKVKADKAVKEAKEKGVEVKTIEDKIIDDILSKPISKEEAEMKNPKLVKTEKSPQSDLSYEVKEDLKDEGKVLKKPSVKQELNNIRKELKEKSNNKTQSKIKENNKSKSNKKIAKKKGKER